MLIILHVIIFTGLLKDIPSSEAERLLSAAPITDADLHLVTKKKDKQEMSTFTFVETTKKCLPISTAFSLLFVWIYF